MRDANDFAKMYREVKDINVYGTTNYIHQFVAERYPNDIEFNIDDINIVNFEKNVGHSHILGMVGHRDSERKPYCSLWKGKSGHRGFDLYRS